MPGQVVTAVGSYKFQSSEQICDDVLQRLGPYASNKTLTILAQVVNHLGFSYMDQRLHLLSKN